MPTEDLIAKLRGVRCVGVEELCWKAADVLDRINMAACYASEENTEARAETLLLIGKLARGEVQP